MTAGQRDAAGVVTDTSRSAPTKPIADIARTPAAWSRTPLGAGTLTLLLVFGIWIRVANQDNVTSRTPDERVYTRQANAVRTAGAEGLRQLVLEYQRDSSLALYPPPTRAGYIWLLAVAMQLTGITDERAGAYLSCAASVTSLILLAVLGVRFLPPWAALCGVLFFAVSPIEVALARRSWPDAPVGCLGLGLVYLACVISRNPQNRIWRALFVTLGSVSIVVKELAPVAYGLIAAWVAWILVVRHKDRRGALSLMAAGLVGLVASVGWLASAVGGVDVLVSIVSRMPANKAANSYDVAYQTGPPWGMLEAFWIASPLASVLCVVGLCVALAPPWLRARSGPVLDGWHREPVSGIAVFFLAFLSLPMILSHWQNLRYVSVIFGPFYLLAALGFWYLVSLGWNHVRRRDRTAFAVVVLAIAAAGAAADIRYFRQAFVRQGTPDLSIRMLRESDR